MSKSDNASTKGWNWGYYHLEKEQLKFSHDKDGDKNCFNLKYKDIAISNASKATEVTLEFQQEADEQRRGDILCEMRFYVPNMEEDENAKAEDKDMKTADADAEGEQVEEVTPAKVFSDKILQHAGLGDSAADIIASFHDLPLQVPRGKYTLEMYEHYGKFHGRTHDWKIMYKDIIKVF